MIGRGRNILYKKYDVSRLDKAIHSRRDENENNKKKSVAIFMGEDTLRDFDINHNIK